MDAGYLISPENLTDLKYIEEKYTCVFNSSSHAYAILNEERRFIEVNKAFEELIEYCKEELIGKTSSDLGMHNAGFIEKRDELLIILLTKGKIENVEIEFTTRTGKQKAILLSVDAITLQNRRHWLINLVNVTEKKKAENKLKTSEEKYRVLIEQASEAVFITSPLCKILIVNNSMIKLTGYSEEELLSMTYFDFLLNEDIATHPLHVMELAKGQTVITERSIKVKGNKLIDVEITAKLLTTGNMLAFAKDITTQKKQRQLLIESEQRLLRAENMGNMGHGFYNLENDTMNLSAGLYKILGISKQNFEHTIQGLLTLLHPEEFKLMGKTIAKLRDKGEIESEFRIVRPSGEVRQVIFKSILTKNIVGESQNLFTTAIDITEQKKAITENKKAHKQIKDYNKKLRKLTTHLQVVREEERRRIGREIHDELGQQLTAIKMDVAWIEKKISSDSTIVHQKIKNIITLLDGSNQSVRRILQELKPSILDEYGLPDAIELLAHQFTANTAIPIKISGDIKAINLSENTSNCIFRIFQESLTNITRHAFAKKVVVIFEIKKNKIYLTVKDDGIGFDLKTLQNKKTYGLLGMQERVKTLAGEFKLSSKPTIGTTLKIGLPFKTKQ